MLIFRTGFLQVAIKGDEYAIYLEDSDLIIQTPAKKYTLTDIDSGGSFANDVLGAILEYIKEHIDQDVIYMDLDEICENEMGIIGDLVISDT